MYILVLIELSKWHSTVQLMNILSKRALTQQQLYQQICSLYSKNAVSNTSRHSFGRAVQKVVPRPITVLTKHKNMIIQTTLGTMFKGKPKLYTIDFFLTRNMLLYIKAHVVQHLWRLHQTSGRWQNKGKKNTCWCAKLLQHPNAPLSCEKMDQTVDYSSTTGGYTQSRVLEPNSHTNEAVYCL